MMGQSMVLGFLSVKTINTLTPLWLVGMGTLAGVVLIALFWGLLLVLSRVPGLSFLQRPAKEFWSVVREGVLFYVLVTALVFCGIGVLGTFVLRPVGESMKILASLPRLTASRDAGVFGDHSRDSRRREARMTWSCQSRMKCR